MPNASYGALHIASDHANVLLYDVQLCGVLPCCVCLRGKLSFAEFLHAEFAEYKAERARFGGQYQGMKALFGSGLTGVQVDEIGEKWQDPRVNTPLRKEPKVALSSSDFRPASGPTIRLRSNDVEVVVHPNPEPLAS